MRPSRSAAFFSNTRYRDPSSVDHLSIHNSFSRFVTIHGTHEATVSNCVGKSWSFLVFLFSLIFSIQWSRSRILHRRWLRKVFSILKYFIIIFIQRKLDCGKSWSGYKAGNHSAIRSNYSYLPRG